MTTVAAEIKTILSGTQKVARLIKKVESSEALQARFDESAAQVGRDTGQVAYAVCRALVADAMGRHPSDDEVNDFLSAAVGDPAFPARAHRLMGEARKAASQRRRAFLSAMLFGLPFTKIPDDERDRVDMAVERMTVPDVEFLLMVAEKRRRGADLTEGQRYIFGPSGVGALLDGTSLRIVTPDLWRNEEFSAEVFEDSRFIGDRAALASLVSVGCVDLAQGVLNAGNKGKVSYLIVLPLGEMVLHALGEVRPGFAAEL